MPARAGRAAAPPGLERHRRHERHGGSATPARQRQRPRSASALVAATGTVAGGMFLTTLPLSSIFTDWTWLTVSILCALPYLAVVCALRYRAVPRWWHSLLGLAASVLMLLWVFVPQHLYYGVLPTSASGRDIGDLVDHARQIMQAEHAPLASSPAAAAAGGVRPGGVALPDRRAGRAAPAAAAGRGAAAGGAGGGLGDLGPIGQPGLVRRGGGRLPADPARRHPAAGRRLGPVGGRLGRPARWWPADGGHRHHRGADRAAAAARGADQPAGPGRPPQRHRQRLRQRQRSGGAEQPGLAAWFAAAANRDHGLPGARLDRRHAVLRPDVRRRRVHRQRLAAVRRSLRRRQPDHR